MKMARVILFTDQIDAMSRFYGEVLGLKRIITNEKGWQEFAAGGARIALHSGPSSPGRKGPKIVFHANDVAALRETLVARGATFGKVRQGGCLSLRRQGPGRQSHPTVEPLKVEIRPLPSRRIPRPSR
jgi:catechol 2,3-dioxygenase-like lactoylglutathione lyase family enzyme